MADNFASCQTCTAAAVGRKKELFGKVMICVSTDRSWLLNTSQNTVALPAGTVVRPGTFKRVAQLAERKLGPADLEKHILFDMKIANTHVLPSGKLTILGELVSAVHGNVPLLTSATMMAPACLWKL